MVGARIRELRTAKHLSLSAVALQAGISASTLSRIETNKQEVDLALFLLLARILQTEPSAILASNGDGPDDGNPLAVRIAALDSRGRLTLWRDLAVARRGTAGRRQQRKSVQIAQHIEELLAQLDFLREQFESIRAELRRRK
jgi:transcriptional regulator with XRE-family HTH domain